MIYVHLVCCAVAAVLLTQVGVSDGAKILGIFPFQARSHSFVNFALMHELVKRGHEVTVISIHPQKEPVKNYTDIVLETSMLDFFKDKSPTNLKDRQKLPVPLMAGMIWHISQLVCDIMLQEEAIQKLIHSTDLHFDLVIMESFFNECFLGFVHKFKAPLIQTCTFGGTPWMTDWFGSPNNYAYVPSTFLNYSDKMNLWERIINTLMETFWKLGRQLYYLPGQDAIMRKYFNESNDLPSISEIEHSTSLLLLNHHFSLSYPKPLMPNIVQVGGMHVKPPKKLPQDLQKYLDEAPEGVIFFSMGSNLKSSEFPEPLRNSFLEAFSKLKQRVLWKWETDTLPGQPSNVKLGKWLPQADILAHPNVRVFMTHGGLLSVQEAIHRGVPMVGIPIFADQELNMARAASAGFGVLMKFDNITTESVTWALTEVIENARYRENAQRISRIYRDQPLTPLEQAAFWTEYVIRHKGAYHMRSAALDLTWYQYLLLDVIAVLALVTGAVVLVLFLLVRAVLRKVCGSSKAKVSSERKNK